MPKPDKDNFSLSLDPKLITFIDRIAHERFMNRSQIVEEALRFYIKTKLMQAENTPEWWNKLYHETFSESNQKIIENNKS